MHAHLIPRGRAIAALLLGLTLLTVAPGAAGADVHAARTAVRSGHLRAGRIRVSITAVYYDPGPGPDPDTNAGRNQEYVVIRNDGRRAVRLGRWTLRDLARPGVAAHVYRFPSFRLRPGRSVRIHTGSGTNTRTDLYQGRSVYVWGDDADRATLKNASGTTMSTCSWGATDTSPKFC